MILTTPSFLTSALMPRKAEKDQEIIVAKAPPTTERLKTPTNKKLKMI